MLRGLSGKVAVVTGAAQGIGAAVVERLVREKMRVVAVDLNADTLAQRMTGFGDAVISVAADVSVEIGVDQYVADATKAFGGFDCLVNNAGILGVSHEIAELSFADFQRVTAVNINSVFLGTQAAIRQLRLRQGGAIVNMSSVAAIRAGKNRCGYAASKAAIIALTKSAAVETGPDNIRINAVCPSAVDTPMSDLVDQGRSQGGSQMSIASRPIARKALPEEIADLVAYLLSDEARFQTGGVYMIDGGATA